MMTAALFLSHPGLTAHIPSIKTVPGSEVVIMNPKIQISLILIVKPLGSNL